MSAGSKNTLLQLVAKHVQTSVVMLTQNAKSKVDKNGHIMRGAFFSSFTSVHHYLTGKKQMMIWVSQKEIKKGMDQSQESEAWGSVGPLATLLTTYDPEQFFVVQVSVGVSSRRLNENDYDAIIELLKVPYATTSDVDQVSSTEISPDFASFYATVSRLSTPHCAFCLKSETSLQICAGCHGVSYCNRTCQKPDWKRHKGNCSVIREVKRNGKRTLRDRLKAKKKYTTK